jgi:hypothetical protein
MHLNSWLLAVTVLLALGASADTHQQLALPPTNRFASQRVVKLIQERERVVEQLGELKREAPSAGRGTKSE